MSHSHSLDEAIALTPTGPNTYTGHTHPGYANMVGPYGGIITAVLLNGALQHPERLGDPISLTVNFAAPISDGAFTVIAKPVRTNRSTQHWFIEIQQDHGVAATATAIFATRRETWSHIEATMPETTPYESLDSADKTLPLTLEFTKRYELKFAKGAPPLDGQPLDSSMTHVWVKDKPNRALDFAALASICDVFFPRIILVRPEWVPIGTVSLTIYFHADQEIIQQQQSQPLLACAQGQRFYNGYFDHSGHVWSKNGTLLASTHQIVYYKS